MGKKVYKKYISLNNWNEHERDCRGMVLTKVVSIRGIWTVIMWLKQSHEKSVFVFLIFKLFFRGNNHSLGKLIKSVRSPITELQVQKIHMTISIQSCLTTSGMVWKVLKLVLPFNSVPFCITGVNSSHVGWVETSGSRGPEDMNVSGSVEKGTNGAWAGDYMHTWGKAAHCYCQGLRFRVRWQGWRTAHYVSPDPHCMWVCLWTWPYSHAS